MALKHKALQLLKRMSALKSSVQRILGLVVSENIGSFVNSLTYEPIFLTQEPIFSR